MKRILLLFFIFSVTYSTAQTISGSTSVTAGQYYTYTFSSYPNVTWSISNGTITSTTSNSATVAWNFSGNGVMNEPVENSASLYAMGGPSAPTEPDINNDLATSGTGTISVYSNGTLEATLTVTITNPPPIIAGTISPSTQTIPYNTASTALTYSGCAAGVRGAGFTYQWQSSPDNFTWTNIPGATGLTYNPGILQGSFSYYRVMATQNQGITQSGSANNAYIATTLTTTPPTVISGGDSGYAIDLTKAVGTPSGGASANASGGVNYSIPINILPGTNGMQPGLGLSYNSQGGEGIAGWGWNLTTLSMISRAGQKYFYNGANAPVSYTNSDAYILDGERLFPISGTNGADGTIYGKEHDDFSKIQSFGSSPDESSPEWFQVTLKNGTVMEYGHINSQLTYGNGDGPILVWLLDKIIDKNGNYCTFSYHIDPALRGYALTEIDYTGNSAAGLQPYNKIIFSYVLKQNAQNTNKYTTGAATASPYLLSGISLTNSSGTTARSYLCDYSLLHGEYFLKSFTEKGSDGSSFNPLRFTYGSDTTGPSVVLSPALSGLSTQATMFADDFHGTGVDGIIDAPYTIDNNNVENYSGYTMYGNIGANPTAPTLHTDYTESLNLNGSSYTLNSTTTANYSVLTNDYDGDGKADVLFTGFTQTTAGIRQLTKVQINYTRLRSSGTYGYDSLLNTTMPVVSGVPYNYMEGSYIIPGDFDGDGSQDYILILGASATSYQFKAFFCSPKKGIYNQEITNFGVGSPSGLDAGYYATTVAFAQAIPVDFDGDGKTDI